ncbi:capsule assembly Wzi family protein [Alkalilimnicola ehrlichii]|uniref:Capsule assembly Wzi family protein n=1 Tax=Alkalilimnicola ehrlichii TaxID=351052 RepID=A0A3E0WNB5_9GAMM|nr:capsule assembly Wzi family protein [Alkalilimnicola ehrlichii]RFA33466.1 hypothetical protein CAL65_17590 [Alkalilimnicola ehrlichii]
MRHDLLLLRDSGRLNMPVSSWPIPYSAIGEGYTPSKSSAQEPWLSAQARMLARVQQAQAPGFSASLGMTLAAEPQTFRGFQDTPREHGGVTAEAGWTSPRYAVRAQAQGVRQADGDNWDARFDNSYGALSAGNWLIAAGTVPQWWGPGWDGSLILSNNARPVPAVILQRQTAQAFEWPILEWLGPWSFVAFAGQLENDRYVPEAKLLGARLTLVPTERLEIGLSRTAQWGGEGRPESLRSLIDLAIGRSNAGDSDYSRDDQPGNQLAGYDIRWRSPLVGDFPYAIYAQAIGEDEAGGWPYQFVWLGGIETWGFAHNGSYRVYFEAADTAIDLFVRSEQRFNTAYEHSAYRSGYRYRGQSLGHGIDNDSRLFTLGTFWAPTRAILAFPCPICRAQSRRAGSAGSRGASPLARSANRCD